MIFEVGLSHYLLLGALLFAIGLGGVIIARRNVITVLMSFELMLLATNINFVAFSTFLDDLIGQVFVLFILTIAAAEVAIGLAIVMLYFRSRDTVDLQDMSKMKG